MRRGIGRLVLAAGVTLGLGAAYVAPGASKEAQRDLGERDLQERALSIVRTLADPRWEGRGVGTAGLDSAARYLAMEMAARGLVPAEIGRAHV